MSTPSGAETDVGRQVISDEVTRYLQDGRDFIDDAALEAACPVRPDAQRVYDILQKSLAVNLHDRGDGDAPERGRPVLWDEIYDVAAQVKRKV